MISGLLSTSWERLLDFVGLTAIVWAPLALLFVLWHVWVFYIRQEWMNNLDWRLLHIKIPRQIYRSPLAMELVLESMYQTGGVGDWWKRWWQGRVRSWFSLEIVSIEGNVYFFIRTESKFIPLLSANIYSQFPQAEIIEVDDYTRHVTPYGEEDSDWGLFGTEYKLGEHDALPIATYIDYGLDKAGSMEESEKIDPITPLIELFGSIGPGEQFWLQILITPAQNRFANKKKGIFHRRDWKAEAVEYLKEIKQEAIKATILDESILKDEDLAKQFKKDMAQFNSTRLTKGQNAKIEAVERSLAKNGFETGMRMLYLAKGDSFRGTMIPAMLSITKPFNELGYNNFSPSNITDLSNPMYEDIAGRRLEGMRRRIFDAYVRRAYFYHPYKRAPFILTTEELATLFHFPGAVSETPSFERIEAIKAEPPGNLPL